MDMRSLALWEQVKIYTDKNRVWLHVPAHGGGRALPAGLQEEFASLASFDLTELPGLDDLFNACGAIADAQEMAAAVWGADSSYFLVNGATAGVLAMLLAACNAGDTVLVARNAHGSVYNGLALCGATPRYLPVAVDRHGFPLNVTIDSVEEALASSAAKAIIITSPSYYGVAADMEGIAAAARRHGALLLLDEAHGAHLGLHRELPLAGGQHADLRVQSWHKTLGALTPGAVLHRHGSRVDEGRLRYALQCVQTSSPSYPVLLSLDAVRKQVAAAGEDFLAPSVQAALQLRQLLRPLVPLLERTDVRKQGFDLDLTRVTILAGSAGLDGRHIARFLSAEGIDMEIAHSCHLLALVGPGYNKGHNARVAEVFARAVACSSPLPCRLPPPPAPVVVCTPREAVFGAYSVLPLAEAVGRVSASTIVTYPPGIPVLVSGELITAEVAEYIEEASRSGLPLRGLDGQERLRCVKEAGG